MQNLEEIFGKYRKKGYELEYIRPVKSVKEADIVFVTDHGEPYALKVYKDLDKRSFKENQPYTEGNHYRKPSVRKAISKNNKFANRYLHRAWVRREYYLLHKLREHGAHLPYAYEFTDESILMQFIGDDGVPAPRLCDIKLSAEQKEAAFYLVLKDIELFYKCGIVRGDLSSFNILWWQDQPVIIDMPQSIDVRSNPAREEMLRRDLKNVGEYFEMDADAVTKRFFDEVVI